MPNIKPISDLRNYTEVLKEVRTNQPVYLTRNGKGAYAIVDINELDRLKASVQLLSKLEEGEQSARKNGWITADEVEAALGL
ncbi:MAG: type II toxin-antitoxin system prevent-host-death family antitoxin [Lachnospiraceae bacterium]|nr:type II toxin-antitoxin system prevent-host-death family antitoxin [Lachnospiraceae bacterium]